MVAFSGGPIPLPPPFFGRHPLFGGGPGSHGMPTFESMMAAVQARARDTAGSDEDVERFAQQLLAAQMPKETPTEQSSIEALPVVSISPEQVSEKAACSVCFDAFNVGDANVLALPCAHLYHKDCLLPWLATHNTCPVCRSPLPAAAPAAAAPVSAVAAATAPSSAALVGPFHPFGMLNSSGIFFGGGSVFGAGGGGAWGVASPPALALGGRGAVMGGMEDGGDDEGDDDEDLRAAIAASLAEEQERQAEAAARGGAGARVRAVGGSASSMPEGSSDAAPPAGAAHSFSARYAVPPEPIPGDADAFTLKLRMPDASSVVRRFPPGATMGQVVEFIVSTDKRPLFGVGSDGAPRVRLVVAGGGAASAGVGPFGPDSWDVPLRDSGLGRRAQLVAEVA